MSKKILGNTKKGVLFIVSAPAGTGKSTLVEMLIKEFPQEIEESCSCTTRPPRPGEIAEHHYDFITEEEFKNKIKKGEFLEHAEVFGYYYGTRKKNVEDVLTKGKHLVLVIDTQGALQLFEKVPESVSIFIFPPSMEELRRRLYKRSTESEEKMEERLNRALLEIEVGREYDYQIVNDDLAITYQILRSIIVAEEHKNRRKNDGN